MGARSFELGSLDSPVIWPSKPHGSRLDTRSPMIASGIHALLRNTSLADRICVAKAARVPCMTLSFMPDAVSRVSKAQPLNVSRQIARFNWGMSTHI